MRNAIFVAAMLAIGISEPATARLFLAGAAATLYEALPYLLLAVVLSRSLPRARALAPFLGCGCAPGPGARSLPAALAVLSLFGPVVAFARLVAAAVVARATRAERDEHAHGTSLLAMLQRLAPSAALASLATLLVPSLHLRSLPALEQIGAGLALGFAASPCALGGVVLAAALRSQSPLAAGALLCIAGIADLSTWYRARAIEGNDDALAYVLLAADASLVAVRGGATFVHPRIALALGACVVGLAAFAWIARHDSNARRRWIPALMLATVVIGAPAPQYAATETTLADAFPGERIDFTGMYVRAHGTPSLVRFAIACCRADAQPVAIVLADTPPRAETSAWFHARGTLAIRNGTLALIPERIDRVLPPSDPFLYL